MSIFGRALIAFPVSDDDPAILVGPLQDPGLPSFGEIIAQMRARPFAFGRVPRFVILRDEDHTQAWLAWYTRLQLELFERDLGQSDKRIAIAVNRSQDWSTISVAFRLSTAGVAGYTQYRIFTRRISEELFACRE
jgi:hypothetical protein